MVGARSFAGLSHTAGIETDGATDGRKQNLTQHLRDDCRMATHSNVLAWRIPGMEEPGRLPSMGLHRVGHD